jgi:mannitol/fructose-specific phosphotransferase system IIA component (Ntr-type)
VKIQDILHRNGIIIDLKADEKNKILTQMSQFLSSINNLKKPDIIIQKILERESDISTGIGFGIAIPHARTDIADHICMVAARCVAGIDFNSLDEQPVHLIFMLASPTGNSDDLRSILSALSKIMSYEDMREKLIAASDPEDFLRFLIDGENKYVKA